MAAQTPGSLWRCGMRTTTCVGPTATVNSRKSQPFGSGAGPRPTGKRSDRSSWRLLAHESDRAGCLLAGASQAIGKHLRDRPVGAGVAPEFMQAQLRADRQPPPMRASDSTSTAAQPRLETCPWCRRGVPLERVLGRWGAVRSGSADVGPGQSSALPECRIDAVLVSSVDATLCTRSGWSMAGAVLVVHVVSIA
jgi:hypothetical protein